MERSQSRQRQYCRWSAPRYSADSRTTGDDLFIIAAGALRRCSTVKVQGCSISTPSEAEIMTAFVHPAAFLCGRVLLGDRASIWPYAVLRADSDEIRVGVESNVQDGTIIHCDPGFPALVGARVAIGHRAVIHGCTIEDDCLIGMGAIILNGARV